MTPAAQPDQALEPDWETLAAYARGATRHADRWARQAPARDVFALVEAFFAPGGPTADVGCGAGHHTAALAERGFTPIGYDASPELLEEARRRHPGLRFVNATLPELAIAESGFANVFCETVIMHLSPQAVPMAVRRMLEILRPGGTLYLSWRTSPGGEHRDGHGRLYSDLDPAAIRAALGATTILYERETTASASAQMVRRIVARRAPVDS